MEVTGFHGTSRASSGSILANGFDLSRNEYDWLGEGVYFFQDAPLRARDWARERFGREAAVVMATIDLDGCMDLLDIGWQENLTETFHLLKSDARRSGVTLPVQSKGAHRLDASVVDATVDMLRKKGQIVRSVRAAFVEGQPLYPGSALHGRTHIQIAVRDESAITHVSWEGPYA